MGNELKEIAPLQTLGKPVLPLVYIITAMSAERGRSASVGFSWPSLSTSENEVIVQLLPLSINEPLDDISLSMHTIRFTVSSCPLMSKSFFSSLFAQITVVTSVWRIGDSGEYINNKNMRPWVWKGNLISLCIKNLVFCFLLKKLRNEGN